MNTTPLSNKPKITQQDIFSGYVTRYFVRNVSTGNVTEVDQKQYEKFKKNSMYETLELQWSISGNANDGTSVDGKTIYGTRHKNTVTIAFYERQMRGLSRILRNPLEYFSGVFNKEITVVTNSAAASVYSVTTPTTTTTTAPPTTTTTTTTTEPPITTTTTTTTTTSTSTTTTTTAAPITLTRSSLGRLAAHASSPITNVSTAFSVSDWSTKANVTISTAGTTLDFTSATSNVFRTMTYALIPTRSQAFVQAVGRAVSTGAVVGAVVRADSGSAEYDGVWVGLPAGFSGPVGTREINGGVDIATNTASAALAANTDYRMGVATDAASGSISYVFAGPSFLTASAYPLTLTRGGGTYSGMVGLIHSRGSAGTTRYTDFYAMSSRYITVTGLPSSSTVQVRNSTGTVLASASAALGTASVDMLTVVFPTATEIRVLDSASNVLVTSTPTERVWGGDTWVYG